MELFLAAYLDVMVPDMKELCMVVYIVRRSRRESIMVSVVAVFVLLIL